MLLPYIDVSCTSQTFCLFNLSRIEYSTLQKTSPSHHNGLTYFLYMTYQHRLETHDLPYHISTLSVLYTFLLLSFSGLLGQQHPQLWKANLQLQLDGYHLESLINQPSYLPVLFVPWQTCLHLNVPSLTVAILLIIGQEEAYKNLPKSFQLETVVVKVVCLIQTSQVCDHST